MFISFLRSSVKTIPNDLVAGSWASNSNHNRGNQQQSVLVKEESTQWIKIDFIY